MTDIIYSDGFCLGTNPSRSGGGYLLCDEDKNIIKRDTIYKKNFTNNEAELLGILEASRLLNSHGIIYTDSQCVKIWVEAGYSKARPDLKNLMQEAKKNIEKKSLFVVWIRRERNKAGIILEEELNSRRKI